MADKVQISVRVEARILALLDEREASTGETPAKAIARLLREYFLAYGTSTPPAVPTTPVNEPVLKVVWVTRDMRTALRKHRLLTGESASDLIRRLLREWEDGLPTHGGIEVGHRQG